MHHLEQYPSRMTLEISKCLEPKGRMEPRVREIPPQIQKTGLIFHPSPWGRLIESCLSSLSSFFFLLSFLVGEAGELRKERRCYQEGNAFRVSECQRQLVSTILLACGWSAGDYRLVPWTAAQLIQCETQAPQQSAPAVTCATPLHHPVRLLALQRNLAAQSF